MPAAARGGRSGDGRSALLLDEAKAARIEAVIAAQWPETIARTKSVSAHLAAQVIAARSALLAALEPPELA